MRRVSRRTGKAGYQQKGRYLGGPQETRYMANSRVPKRLALEDISNHQNNGLTVNEPVPLGKDGASVLLLAAEASENTELGAGAGGTSNVNIGAPPCGGESSPVAALPSEGRAPKGLAKLLEEL
mgnify:CR=1 FL=1